MREQNSILTIKLVDINRIYDLFIFRCVLYFQELWVFKKLDFNGNGSMFCEDLNCITTFRISIIHLQKHMVILLTYIFNLLFYSVQK